MMSFRVFVTSVFAENVPPALKKYSISEVTVSGLSSGGFMAVQLHAAFNSVIKENDLNTGFYKCALTTLGVPDADHLVNLARSFEASGFIDKTSNLLDDKVYIYSGTADTVVEPPVVKSLLSYYNAFVSPANIVADFNFPSEHCWPTLAYGKECLTLSSPYVGKCQLDGAHSALSTLFGAKLSAPRGIAIPTNLMAFSQKPYWPKTDASLGDTGYLYVPTACSTTTFHLHVSLHGCQQTFADIDTQFLANIGLNEWAETNNIIVLYPFTQKSPVLPYNPEGCWDFWGYTNENYAFKTGLQMQFIRDMITAVSGI